MAVKSSKKPRDTETFAGRLQQLRAEKNLTQTELGNLVDTHYTQIARYEAGVSKPSADVISLLAEKLGVSADYLLYGARENAAVADMADNELLNLFKEVSQLPEEKKALAKDFLSILAQHQRMQKAAS